MTGYHSLAFLCSKCFPFSIILSFDFSQLLDAARYPPQVLQAFTSSLVVQTELNLILRASNIVLADYGRGFCVHT